MNIETIPISICIPIYNGSRFLYDCFKSVQAQTFTNFEIIVVDDCSQDESYQIAKEFSIQDKRIRIFRNSENLGLVNNWNRCIELSKGEWIKFVFQDDLLETTCLENMLGNGDFNQSIIACRRKFLFENISSDIARKFEKYSTWMSMDSIFGGQHDISADAFCNAILQNLGNNFVGEPTAVMLHRSIFERFGKFNSNFIQFCDMEFWSRVACNCGIRYIPKTLATFRLHQDATSLKNLYCSSANLFHSDKLLLYHEFSSNPFFENLRYNAMKKSPPLNMEILSILYHIRTEAISKFKSFRRLYRDTSHVEKWEAYQQKFPMTITPPKYRWLKIFSPLIMSERIMWFIYRQLLMRFAHIKN